MVCPSGYLASFFLWCVSMAKKPDPNQGTLFGEQSQGDSNEVRFHPLTGPAEEFWKFHNNHAEVYRNVLAIAIRHLEARKGKYLGKVPSGPILSIHHVFEDLRKSKSLGLSKALWFEAREYIAFYSQFLMQQDERLAGRFTLPDQAEISYED